MFIIRTIINLIKINPGKVIGLSLILIMGSLGFIIDESKEQERFVDEFQWSDKYVYILEIDDRLEVKTFNEKQFTKGEFVFYESNVVNFILFLISGVLLFLFIIFSIIGFDDSDVGWELKLAINNTYMSLVKCDIESGVYYYHLNGKLLKSSEFELNDFKLYTLVANTNYKKLPSFEGTKRDKRDVLLKKLLK